MFGSKLSSIGLAVAVMALLSGCDEQEAFKAEDPQPNLGKADSADEQLPSIEALGEWRPRTGYADEEWPLDRLEETPFRGNEPMLYPTQPQQGTKSYHRYDYASYDRRLLDATDYACTLSMLTRMSPDARRRAIERAEEQGRPIPCLQGDIAYDLVFSGTYVDDQGNAYRGVARQVFLGSEESLGHSVALGHTFYPKPDSPFENDMYDGGTYAVPVSNFIMLAELLPGDAEKIAELQERAEDTHDRDGLLWVHNGEF